MTGSLDENLFSRKPEQIPSAYPARPTGRCSTLRELSCGLKGAIYSARREALPAKLARIRPLR